MIFRAGLVLSLAALVWWPRGVAIVDGDTFDVGPWRYRLFGIDTPEPGKDCQRAALRQIVAGVEVICETIYREPITRWPPRWVANCRTASTPDIAFALVLAGWACDYRKYSKGRFAAVEAQANAARRGLWACDDTHHSSPKLMRYGSFRASLG
jgi:micrococcal nuclease